VPTQLPKDLHPKTACAPDADSDVSTLDALQMQFDVGISHIDGWVAMLPD
jgi:hypothetical protein